MAGKGNFLTTYRGKQILGIVYGGGAAVVIIGAWAKILHLPIANTMLTVGLLTEAVIFIISCFEPPHRDPDWSRFYPELASVFEANNLKFTKQKPGTTIRKSK
jgi:gliding motility-associated protein GldL